MTDWIGCISLSLCRILPFPAWMHEIGCWISGVWATSWSCTGEVCANTSSGFRYSFVRSCKTISLVKTVEKKNYLFLHKYFNINQYPLDEALYTKPRPYKTGRSGWYTRRSCCHPERPGQAGEMGQQEPRASQRRELQSPVLGEEQPQAPVQAGGCPAGKQPGRGRTWGSWWRLSWTWASNVPSWQRRRLTSRAAFGRALPTVEEVILPLHSAVVRHTWSAGPSAGLPVWETWTYWNESKAGSRLRVWSI